MGSADLQSREVDQAVRPYGALSLAGKLRRLHGLALEALSGYDLQQPEIVYHGFDTNLLFRVHTASGERFMLRLAYPGWRTLEDLQSEAMWLDALARDTAVRAPRVVPSRSGEKVLPMAGPGIDRTWNATLMTWLPGRLLGHYLTECNLAKMGALFAELHCHGGSWEPPSGFTTRRFEHWLSRGEENRIVGDGSRERPGHGGTGLPSLPPGSRELLERAHARVEAAYAAIDRADLRVIHCDLWHDNVKLHRGELYPFDFEDTVWGFRAHDIAMAMLDLMEVTDEAQYRRLLGAFRRGYGAHLDWPEDPIEPLQAGRLLWKINGVARFEPQSLPKMVEQHAPVLERFLQTGQVVRPPVL